MGASTSMELRKNQDVFDRKFPADWLVWYGLVWPLSSSPEQVADSRIPDFQFTEHCREAVEFLERQAAGNFSKKQARVIPVHRWY